MHFNTGKTTMSRTLKAALFLTTIFFSSSAFAINPPRGTDVSFPTDDPWLTYHVLDVGEQITLQDETMVSGYELSDEDIGTLEKGTQFWETYLRAHAAASGELIPIAVIPVNQDDGNAAATSLPIPAGNEYAGMTEFEASIVHGYRDYQYNAGYAALIMIDKPDAGQRWYTGPIQTLTKNGDDMSLSSTIAHELFHALGVSSSAGYDSEAHESRFDEDLSLWDGLLRDASGEIDPETGILGEGQRPVAGQKVVTRAEGCDAGSCFYTLGVYNTEEEEYEHPSYGGVYLTGDNILEVLDGATLLSPSLAPNDSDEQYRVRVRGVPVNTWEISPDDEEHPELGMHFGADFSHVELQNSLMSHQNYRNWGTFMEVELAILQDMGYQLDRRNFFGYSVYDDGLVGDNENGFFARENGEYVIGKPNTSSWGVGLHIYGSENDVTQKADLLADGFSGIGVRVDGSENMLRIPSATRVTANGQYGYGILFSYGKEQKLVLQGDVEATGDKGTAVAFDFGDNMLSNKAEYRGSYIWVKDDIIKEETENLLPELQGALMASADITGSVTGSEKAVYIGPTAFVRNINFMNGAYVDGDIVSDWQPVTNSDIIVQDAPETSLRTNLTFGYTPDGNGVKTDAPDPTFSMTVNGDIGGPESLDMTLAGGTLAVTGTVDVYSLTTNADTVLSLTLTDASKTEAVVQADTIVIGGDLAYTLDPALSGLNEGDMLSVLDAQTALTWTNPQEKYSFEALFDSYTFNYVYDQEGKTLRMRVAQTESKQAAAQSSSQMTVAVISVVGNKIMGRLNNIGGVKTPSVASSGPRARSGARGMRGQSGGDAFEETGIWGKALYTHARKTGGNSFKADIYGGVIGADTKLSDALTAGLALSYSSTNGKAGRTDADADTYAAFLYGSYAQTANLSYSMIVGGGLSRFDVENAEKFNAGFMNAQGYVDYRLGAGFTAQTGARYVLTHQEKYTAGGTMFKMKNADTLTGVLGGKYDYVSGRFGVQARAAAIYDFIADKSAFLATNRVASMFVDGERLHRLGAEFGASATMQLKKWDFELGYDAQIRKDYHDQTVSLKAGYHF